MNDAFHVLSGLPEPDCGLSARLSCSDMLWAQAPRGHGNALEDPAASALTREYSAFGSVPFWGNGNLGMMLWPCDDGLLLEFNSASTWDKRAAAPTLYGRNRIRVGRFLLRCGAAAPDGWDLRLSLWDARLHLPYTWSPEWGVNTKDSSFELALLRWCCRKLLRAYRKLGRAGALSGAAQIILSDLTDYPQNAEHGLYVGENEPYHHSHRHWSHLFAVYPCGELRPDSGQTRAPYLWPNTMYTEMGELEWPTLETPVGVSRAVQEMLLCADGEIEVFPAIPQDWKDAGFLRLRAAGGFAVSAARRGGQTEWICVESLAGQPLCLKLPPELAKHRARVHGCTCEWDGEQRLTAAGMAAGERLVVCARGLKSLQFNVSSSPARWGGKKPV